MTNIFLLSQTALQKIKKNLVKFIICSLHCNWIKKIWLRFDFWLKNEVISAKKQDRFSQAKPQRKSTLFCFWIDDIIFQNTENCRPGTWDLSEIFLQLNNYNGVCPWTFCKIHLLNTSSKTFYHQCLQNVSIRRQNSCLVALKMPGKAIWL